MQRGRFTPGSQPPPTDRLPPGYLQRGYFDSAGNILPEVIVDWPRTLANSLARKRMKAAQVRRFFNEVRRLEARLRAGAAFAALRSDILKLDSYAENAVKRGNAPPLFREFISKNLGWATRDEKHFDAFVQHFECLIGYYPETR